VGPERAPRRHGQGGDDNDDNQLEIAGAISALSATSITVGGHVFTIGDNTSFFNQDRTQAQLSDFAVGDLVQIKGVLNGDNTWTAVRIKAEDQNGGGDDDNLDLREFGGTISAITATSVTIGGKTYTLNGDTQFTGGATGTSADFTVGSGVEGTLTLVNGQWVVSQLRLEDNGGDDNGDDNGDDHGND